MATGHESGMEPDDLGPHVAVLLASWHWVLETALGSALLMVKMYERYHSPQERWHCRSGILLQRFHNPQERWHEAVLGITSPCVTGILPDG